MEVVIDPGAGFCFGVVRAIRMAERELGAHGELLCLGDIVHNGAEVARLEAMGLRAITHREMGDLAPGSLLLRAHGEPPSTYERARALGHRVVDATCPVVLALQRKVRMAGERMAAVGGQIMIYGKPDHAEVIGLMGQTVCPRHVVLRPEDLDALRADCPTECFSQTTMSPRDYEVVTRALRARMEAAMSVTSVPLVVHRTTCSRVSNRRVEIEAFARGCDAVLFVSGRKSSNGQMLFGYCRDVNGRSHLVSGPEEVEAGWLSGARRVGVSGATSTPGWLMGLVADRARALSREGGDRGGA